MNDIPNASNGVSHKKYCRPREGDADYGRHIVEFSDHGESHPTWRETARQTLRRKDDKSGHSICSTTFSTLRASINGIVISCESDPHDDYLTWELETGDTLDDAQGHLFERPAISVSILQE